MAHAADFQVDELEHVRKLKEVLRPLSGSMTLQHMAQHNATRLVGHNVRQEPIVVWYWKYNSENWRNLVDLDRKILNE